IGETASSIAAAPKFGFGWYVSRKGDTLESIAASHLATPADLIRLNPGVAWDGLGVGAPVKVPAAYEPAVAMQGGGTFAGGAQNAPRNEAPAYAYPVSRSVTAVMPYNFRREIPNGGAGAGVSSLLTVDRQSVSPGGKVVVSGAKLPPNSEVSLYRGANGRQMVYVGSVKTDEKGAFSEPVRVKRESNLGGVIFKATVDKSGQSLQSPRVGVNQLKDSDELEPEDDDASEN
ncbi:MAG TPA: LysM domain-containing protein, partial [Parvularculaceae bacterium]|nr:LysM domain-containing protein [Parvularculaceae bacterium]